MPERENTISENILKSRGFEMKTYIDSMRSMYINAIDQNSELYDIANEMTKGFTQISTQSILNDSRIIKILRYAIAPTISQMKFGQFFNINSIDRFENNKLAEDSPRFRELEKIAPQIVDFVLKNLDYSRFIWIKEPKMLSPLAKEYAKKWTCSIAADQNAQTTYRNWRKQQQELAISSMLISMGYTKSEFKGVVRKFTDINIGEFTQEIKVKGRTIQKADIVFRSKKTKKIVLLEAKAVGVEIDATKRIKECCDKASDWNSNKELSNPTIATVIAGFFTLTNIENLEASNIEVIWEHDLKSIKRIG